MRAGIAYVDRQSVFIPAGTNAVRLVAKGIDGIPPDMPRHLTVAEFLRRAKELQTTQGHGEWEVAAYAVTGRRRRLLARWDYMFWHYLDFSMGQ